MKTDILRYQRQTFSSLEDLLSPEEPLEIRIRLNGVAHRIAVTMRTPGDLPESDHELAVGFLFSEGILSKRSDVVSIRSEDNSVELELAQDVKFDMKKLERHFYVSSSCGICGKSSIDSVWEQARFCDRTGPGSGPWMAGALVLELPTKLREAQAIFSRTGGLHASGYFSTQGELQLLREDVGRHNALDKIIGRFFLDGRLPMDSGVLLLSGRISFELVQKAAMAGIRIIAAVGAPSSLALELTRELDLTLIGFIREDRFNLYHGRWRVSSP